MGAPGESGVAGDVTVVLTSAATTGAPFSISLAKALNALALPVRPLTAGTLSLLAAIGLLLTTTVTVLLAQLAGLAFSQIS